MKDFNFYVPTRVVFGKQSEEQLPRLLKEAGGKKVLVHYGGGSAKRSGLLDKVYGMLDDAGIEHVELGGVVPNPLLSKVNEGIDLCRRKEVDFILAVGGGSVIDSAKAIAYGVLTKETCGTSGMESRPQPPSRWVPCSPSPPPVRK